MVDYSEIGSAVFAQEEVRKNYWKSLFLIIILIAIVLGLSYWIGAELGDVRMGLGIGVIVSFVVIPIQIMTAKWAILGMARGKAANPEILAERRAMQLLEGLAISAGLSRTPDLYIIPSQVPNAFASGLTEAGAFVAVTQGLLDMMDEQELEGVLAHEVSHIIHRDIMLNQLVVGLISVILILAVILERVLLLKSIHGDRRDRNDNGRFSNCDIDIGCNTDSTIGNIDCAAFTNGYQPQARICS